MAQAAIEEAGVSVWLGWAAPPSELEQWFEADRDARFVLSADGGLMRANAAARALIDDDQVRVGPASRLSIGDATSDAELDLAIKEGGTHPARFVVCLRNGRHCAADLRFPGTRGTAILSIYSSAKPVMSESLEPVGRRFGLTPTELRVLGGICDGLGAKQIAREHRLSEHTIRANLRSIYAKLGVGSMTASATAALRLAR